MSVTSDSDPVEQDGNSSDTFGSPKATSPLLKQTSRDSGSGGGGGGKMATVTGGGQRHSGHVLIRQKASYKNSVDI